jgi:hypothetical protein
MTLVLKKPAVLLEGGPKHGWSYHEDYMPTLVAAYEHVGEVFPYRPTGRFEVHPRTAGKHSSRVWEYFEPEAPEPTYAELLAAKDAAMRRAIQASVRDPWDEL